MAYLGESLESSWRRKQQKTAWLIIGVAASAASGVMSVKMAREESEYPRRQPENILNQRSDRRKCGSKAYQHQRK
jgi:hypothetical protein